MSELEKRNGVTTEDEASEIPVSYTKQEPAANREGEGSEVAGEVYKKEYK